MYITYSNSSLCCVNTCSPMREPVQSGTEHIVSVSTFSTDLTACSAAGDVEWCRERSCRFFTNMLQYVVLSDN